MAKLFFYGSELEILENDEPSGYEDISTTEALSSHPLRSIDPLKLEAAFLDYCVRHGWIAIRREGDAYRCFLTLEGEGELKRFGLAHLY